MCVVLALTSIGAARRLGVEAPPELLAPFDREGRDRERTFQSGAWGRLLRVQPVQLPDRDPRRILVDQFHLLPRFRDPLLHDPIVPPAPPQGPDEGDRLGVA